MNKCSSSPLALAVVLTIATGLVLSGGTLASAADNPQKWILSVGPNFEPVDLQGAGGTLDWYWEEAGIAVAVSADPAFGDLVLGANVSLAVADVAAKPPKTLSLPRTTSSPILLDAFANNWQWYWQAIGAVRIGPANEPVWQLGDYTGSGVKIGIIDTGAPALWDPPDPFAPIGNPVALHPEFAEFDPTHPEEGGVVLLRDPVTNEVTNFDVWGHGTAVGSTIGARHRGEGAMRGLAPKATLYFHEIDWDNFASSALEGWYRAAEFGCQILNNSWFDLDLPVMRFDDVVVKLPVVFRKAATELQRRGILIVAAAGNDSIDPNKDGDTFYPWDALGQDHGLSSLLLIPQDMPHVIVVGGTGPSDYDPSAPDLSIYDPAPGRPNRVQKGWNYNLDRVANTDLTSVGGIGAFGSSYGPFLSLVAPMGANIKDWDSPLGLYQFMYVAAPWVWPGQEDYPYHDWWQGTSFSSPITCGVAALAAEAYYREHGAMPSPTTLAWILRSSADDLVGPATDDLWVWSEKTLQFEFRTDVPADTPSTDMRYGHGRVNAVKAIELAGR